MDRKKAIKSLYVYINGESVGILHRQSTGELEFKYTTDWIQNSEAYPISLSLPLSVRSHKGSVVSNFFENLLPDNKNILERIQARFQAKSTRCFDLLEHIGLDCVGALQLLTEEKSFDVKKIKADPIDDKSISDLLKNYKLSPLGMQKNSEFRISIAGAQEKMAFLWHEDQWKEPKGSTPTSHIVKLPIGFLQHSGIDLSDSVENEWLCLKILSEFGMPVNSAEIKFFEDVKTLVVERFDRKWADDKSWLMRIPQEDMCQVLGVSPGLKYESDGGPGIKNIMHILEGANKARDDRYQFMKSVFLFWLLGAIDGHAKNFSIQIRALGRYDLTPIYDVMSAYPIVVKHKWQIQDLKMAMGLKSKNKHYRWDKIQRRHWLAMAGLCKFDEETMDKIIDEVCDQAEDVVDKVSTALPSDFPAEIAEPIFEGIKRAKNKCVKLAA